MSPTRLRSRSCANPPPPSRRCASSSSRSTRILRFALVIAANRDEYHARPAAPAAWGHDGAFGGVLAGRDLTAGGTWLGVRRDGRFALVTNVREGKPQNPAARSRGELVPRAPRRRAVRRCLRDARARATTASTCSPATRPRLAWMSNRAALTRRVRDGVHGLSNALLDMPWPKIVRTRGADARVERGRRRRSSPLFAALGDRAKAPDDELPSTGVTLERERMLSAPFIVSESYGTRCSTVLTVDRDGHARFVERTFAPDGTATGEVAIEEFELTPASGPHHRPVRDAGLHERARPIGAKP